jgi:Na+/proline symporter
VDDEQGGMKMGYGRFAAMIATSTVVMFGLMYLNTYELSHVFYSQTRTWMAIYMGAVMAIIMLGFMWSMYSNRRANLAIIAGSVIVFAGALWLVRSQETVDDVSWMKAMIPHHSIAIMTSERAHIKDPEVRKLADGIIDAQVREIAEMKAMIARLEAQPTPNGAPDLPSYRDEGVAPPAPQTDQSTGINTLQPTN